MAIVLSGSVGRDGPKKPALNNPADVELIQKLLNQAGAIPTLAVDKKIGPNTIAAIERFQSGFMTKPDGRVDPGGRTLVKLLEAQPKQPWPLLLVRRRTYRSSDNWGEMLLMTKAGNWESFCYSYELPWDPDESGKSKNEVSRIDIGTYEMKPRSDGDKGWRLELQGTGHRKNIQVHRAHKSMVIEGCILPVHFLGFESSGPKKGDAVIQTKSEALMQRIKDRYTELKAGRVGNPTILISATLPAKLETPGLALA